MASIRVYFRRIAVFILFICSGYELNLANSKPSNAGEPSLGHATSAQMPYILSASARADSGVGSVIYDVDSYESLLQMGLEYLRAGQFDQARETFLEMQAIVHRAYGVMAIQQADTLGLLIETYIGLDDYKQADKLQSFRYAISLKAYQPTDPMLHLARLRMADWYRDSFRYSKALALYLKTSDQLSEPDKLLTFDAQMLHLRSLRSEALTLYIAGFCCASTPLSKAKQLVDSIESFDVVDKTLAARHLVDILYLERQPKLALHTLQILAQKGQALPAALLGFANPKAVADATRNSRQRLLGKMDVKMIRDKSTARANRMNSRLPSALGNPIQVCGNYLETVLVPLARRRLGEMFLDVDLEVDENGRAYNIQLSGDAPIKLRRYIKRTIYAVRFRPAVSAAGVVKPGKIRFRQTFGPILSFTSSNMGGWSSLMVSQACQQFFRN